MIREIANRGRGVRVRGPDGADNEAQRRELALLLL
jgi:hypothetical protein